MLPPFLITRGLKLSARNHGVTKTSTELSSVVLFPLHNSNFLYQIENLVSPPFKSATLVENKTMEGQIGEGCPLGPSRMGPCLGMTILHQLDGDVEKLIADDVDEYNEDDNDKL